MDSELHLAAIVAQNVTAGLVNGQAVAKAAYQLGKREAAAQGTADNTRIAELQAKLSDLQMQLALSQGAVQISQTKLAERTAEIVAWLRDISHLSNDYVTYENLATAIERKFP
jgi:hypothetical protein